MTSVTIRSREACKIARVEWELGMWKLKLSAEQKLAALVAACWALGAAAILINVL